MSNNSKVTGHGTIKKLRTGAVVSVLAVSAVYGVSTAHADEVTTSGDASQTQAGATQAKVTDQQVSDAKAQADSASQAVATQQGVVAQAETAVADTAKAVTDTTSQMAVVEAVTPDVVATANQDAQAKSDALTQAETAVTSAEQSQAGTAKKVADQTTVVSNAEANATKTASAVADAKKKVEAFSTNSDTTELQKNVDDLTAKVATDHQTLSDAVNALETAKVAVANKDQAVKDAQVTVDTATTAEATASKALSDAKTAEAGTASAVTSAQSALDKAKAGTTQEVQTGTKEVTTGGTSTLNKGVATSDFFESNGVVTNDAYLKAIKALADGTGTVDDVKEAIQEGLENYPGSSLADIAAPNTMSFRSWRSNYNPLFANTDTTTKLSVHDLTEQQMTDLSLFYVALVNDVRSKVGTPLLKVTEESVTATKQALKELFNRTFPTYANMTEKELNSKGFWKFGGVNPANSNTDSSDIANNITDVQGSNTLVGTAVANSVQYPRVNGENRGGIYQTMADLKANVLAFVGNFLYGNKGDGVVVPTTGTSTSNFDYALTVLGLKGEKYTSAGIGLDFYTSFNSMGYSAPATYALMLNSDGEAIANPYETVTGGVTKTVPVYETKTVVDEKAVAEAQTTYDKALKADQDAKAKLADAQSTYDTASKALTDAQKRLSDLQNGTVDIQALEDAVTNAKTQFAIDSASLQTAKETLAVAKASAVDKANALSKAQAELVKAKAENETAQTALANAKEELEVLTKANDVATMAVSAAVTARNTAKTASEEATKKAQDLANILANKDTVLANLKAQLADAETKATNAREALATAKEELSKLEATSKEATAKYETLANLKAEQDKAEAEAQRLQELKDKADAITRNGGTPVEVFDDNGNLVDVVDGSANKGVAPTVAQTAFKPKADSKGSYSRVERSQQLPKTGLQDSLLDLLGVGILAGLGLGYTGKRRKG